MKKKTDGLKAISLTIFLLKEGYEKKDKFLSKEGKVHELEISEGQKKLGSLYYKTSEPHDPDWVTKLFSDYIQASKLGITTSSTSAIYVVRCAKRVFALSFGAGRHLLEQEAIEETFGLRATLNSIDSSKLRSIDLKSLEVDPLHSRSQASKPTTFTEFGVNVDQDMVRAVTGEPIDKSLGATMAGRDALAVRVKTSLVDMREKLETYYEKSLEEKYKDSFAWIDNISEVSKKYQTQRLNEALEEKLHKKDLKLIWMAVPDLIEWDRFGGFRYSGFSDALYEDISFDTYSIFTDPSKISVESLRKHHVEYILEDESFVKERWSAYYCMHAQLEHEGETYLLTNGKWYKINSDFVSQVNASLVDIPDIDYVLPAWNEKREDDYNKKAVKFYGVSAALMDKKLIRYPGIPHGVEFCDIYFNNAGNKKDLIHVKKYGGSSVLSHLFWQGVVSGQLFKMDERFREEVNAKLPGTHKIASLKQTPNPDDYRIVFAVGSKQPGKLELPFFSKVSLRNAYRELHQGLGYEVALHKISIPL